LAQTIVVQTQAAESYFPKGLRHKIFIIPNPVITRSKVVHDSKAKTITGVGRLVSQKGFDVLINAFAALAQKYPQWNLIIWGEGPERVQLENLIEQSSLRDRAFLPGLTKPDQVWEDETGIFALSSRFEGFPNVLGEAMAAGLPVVASDCPSGVRELVKDGESGLIVNVDDISAMTDALERLIQDSMLRERLGHNARKSVTKYKPEQIALLWERLFEDSI
jgi:glycosyltransferase involved in cell wall biosynthesis